MPRATTAAVAAATAGTPVHDEAGTVLNDREHCLLRPETYIGSVVPEECVYLRFEHTDDGFVAHRDVTVVASGLLHLFTEIAANAMDRASEDPTMRTIRITIDDATGEITILNDGESIEVRKHQQLTDMYLTSVLCSVFRSGTNFDDTQQRKKVGRNGYGIKLVNTWSTKFTIDHHDGKHHFVQTWTNNLEHTDGPTVKANRRKGTYTKVSFIPDYARLGCADHTTVTAYLRSLSWNVAVMSDARVTVYLDGTRLPVKGIRDYAALVAGVPKGQVVHEEGTDFEVAVVPQRRDMDTSVLGFVNGMPCNAGSHVTYALSRIAKQIRPPRGNGPECQPAMLQQAALVLVRASVTNPAYRSQTKDELKIDMRGSGAEWKPSDKFGKKLRASEVGQRLLDVAQGKVDSKAMRDAASVLGGRSRRLPQIENCEHANNAGKQNRTTPVVLQLTEGISAAGFSARGYSVVGRDNFGIFPLRGKPLNVRGESLTNVLNNVEIRAVLAILGVDLRNPPKTVAELNYDEIWVVSDMDLDGSHIAGLVINAFAVLLPELLKNHPTFIKRFATPLVRATPSSRTVGEPREFMSEAKFDAWWNALPEPQRKRYEVKYFKGLATSSARDAKRCYQNLDRYVVAIDCSNPADLDLLKDCFDKDKVARRRELINEPRPPPIDYGQQSISLATFLRGELVAFFRYDNERSIPHVVDGLKIALRKLLWTVFQKYRTVTRPTIKMAQFAAATAEFTDYKHGETSLSGGGIGMAKDMPVSGNNINLLVPEGDYGDRHGREAGSARYIFTCAEPIARVLYPEADFAVLERVVQEGHEIEPKHLVPVIPMVLANGADGLGTGWSTEVPTFDPVDILAWCREYNAALREAREPKLPVLVPHIEGFRGRPTEVAPGKWVYEGEMHRTDDHSVTVRDLPHYTSEFLKKTAKKTENFKLKHPYTITSRSTDTDVDFDVTFDEPIADAAYERLQREASRTVHTTNMHLWTVDGRLVRFDTADDIARHHAVARLACYERRKVHQLGELDEQILKLSDKIRFLLRVADNPDFIRRRPKDDVVADLDADGYARIDGSYDHLLRLPLLSITKELIDKHRRDVIDTQVERDALAAATTHDMWDRELDAVETAYAEFMETRLRRREVPDDNDDDDDDNTLISARPMVAGGGSGGPKRRKKKKRSAKRNVVTQAT